MQVFKSPLDYKLTGCSHISVKTVEEIVSIKIWALPISSSPLFEYLTMHCWYWFLLLPLLHINWHRDTNPHFHPAPEKGNRAPSPSVLLYEQLEITPYHADTGQSLLDQPVGPGDILNASAGTMKGMEQVASDGKGIWQDSFASNWILNWLMMVQHQSLSRGLR